MDAIGVLMTYPTMDYLEAELEKRFKLFKLWQYPSMAEFSKKHSDSIQAVVGDTTIGVDAEMIDSLPGLAIVATCSVGLDKIDLRKCHERGIRVTNTPDVLTDDVADLAIGLILGVLRRICASDGFVRSGFWKNSSEFPLTTRFSGKSVGIVGLGRIGTAIAKRAQAFGCKISYFSRSQKPYSYKYYSNIMDLASNCEILVVSCALTEQTRHIVDRKVMDALGPRGILVNIGRGPHVDERELVSALREGRLGGAGLDVFEKEPEVSEDLFGLENVVILPHVGTDTVDTSRAMADLVVRNLQAFSLNKPLLTPVV